MNETVINNNLLQGHNLMKRILSDDDRNRLDTLIADTEKRTNTQIVLALIQRSDSYAELPWKAFALGASVTGLIVFILNLLVYDWYPRITVLIAIAGVLAGGAVFALLTLLIPGFARRFLSAMRAEVEVQQYAESLFLLRELFSTSKRTGILVLVSLFEKKVVILPDKGLSERLPRDAMHHIIAAITSFLKRSEISRAFEAGLEQISLTLGTNVSGKNDNELSDEIIEEKGV
jgi:putative membrane protein